MSGLILSAAVTVSHSLFVFTFILTAISRHWFKEEQEKREERIPNGVMKDVPDDAE